MIELNEIVKVYRAGWYRRRRSVRALDGVTLRIERGSALGIIGLNGAGKSTLLRVLLGYARPTGGEVLLDGSPPRAYVERNGIAYVPERVSVPRSWTVRSALRAYAMLADLQANAWERVDAAMSRLGLDGIADRGVSALSKGNLQRLGIAQAILADRKLMVLDEPTDGLDPVWIAALREVIAEWRAADADRTLVLASHNLSEVGRLTDHAIVLHNGRVQGELPSGGAGGALENRFLAHIRKLEEARN